MMAEKEETTCLINVTQRGSVKTSVPVPMKVIKDKSPVQEPVITDGKGERSCLLDGGKSIFYVKQR